MTPDTRYVSTKCFSSDKEEKNQGGTAESFVPTKGGWFLFYVLKDVYEKGEMKNAAEQKRKSDLQCNDVFYHGALDEHV